ncbi:MAG: autotransporter domain-containing protein [Succinatimonas hippei]|nr:autotransporter domain-containing protein [Succinatimonas hippei]
MIKQTRGALTMLLSVYRSVLKNAYLKNFAAVALAASVGVASAAEAPSVSENLKLQETPIELNADATVTAGTDNAEYKNSASATVNDISISKDEGTATLFVIANAGKNGTATLTVNKLLTIKKGGKVTLTGDTTPAAENVIPNAATINGKIVLDAGDDDEASTSVLEFANGRTVVGDVNVKNGTLDFKDGVALAESIESEAKGKITVASAATMIVEKDLNLKDNAILSNDGSIETFGTATIGKLAEESKLGHLAFNGEANILESVGEHDTLIFNKKGTFADNVTNKGSIILNKKANISVKGNGVLTNDSSLSVAAYADVALTGKLKNSSNGDITVTAATEDGKTTKATFTGDVVNEGDIILNKGSDVTFASVLSNSGTVKTGCMLGGSAIGTEIGENTNNKTVASFADVKNAGTGIITLGADSKVSFAKLVNEGTLDSSTDLDLVGKLANTGVVKVKAGTLKASLKDLGIGLAEAANVKVNVGTDDSAVLDIGDAEISDNIFATDETATKINNDGKIHAGTLKINDTDEKAVDAILANAGKLSVDSLQINKGIGTLSNATLTVKNAISSESKDATITSSVALENDGKVDGTVSGFKSVIASIKGLWKLGSADIKATSTIDSANVSKVGTIEGATITGKSIVTAATVNAAKLSGESVLNADKVVATAASDAPITLDKSTLNVVSVTVAAGSNDADAAIKASNVSTVKITGEYKAVTNGLVANLDGSTLELNANNNKSGDGIETIRGNATSTLVINGVTGPVKLSKNTELQNSLAAGADGTLAGVYKKIGVNGSKFAGQIKGLTYDTTGVVTDGKVAFGAIGDYSTIASSTDAFASAQVTAAQTVDQALNVGSLEIASGNTSSAINADVTLNKADGNGNFISIEDKTGAEAIAGAQIAENKTLTLNGNGTIGAINGGADTKGTLVANGTITAGNIGETGKTLSTLEVKSGTLNANAVSAQTTTVNGNLVADSLTAATATINGGLTLTKNTETSASGALVVTTGALTTGKNAVVTAENISVGGNSSLSGKVTASGTLSMNNHELNIGAVDDGAGAVTSTGTVSAKTLDSTSGAVNVKAGLLTVTGDTATTLTGGLKVCKAGAVSFANDVTLDTVASTIEGSLSANVLTAKKALSVNGGGNVNVAELTGAGDITVGQDDVSNGTGSVYANKLTSTGKIFIDPSFGQQAAFVGAEHLQTNAGTGVEETTGDIVVGKNAALAVGVSSVDQARSVLSSLGLTDANGSFKQNGVENAIYTDALVKLGSGKGLTVDSSATSATAGVITLGDKSAVVIGKNAAAQSVKDRKAVLTADINGTGVTVAGKSKVIFAGNATKQDIKDVKVFGNEGAGNQVFADADEAAKVSVQLSPLYNEAKLTVDGGITDITVNRGYINTALYNASLPVKNLVAEVADTALTGDGVGSDFIMENALVDGGANIESAARLATFGGAYQAAAAAVNTGIDAAQARLGLGIDNSAEVKGEDISVWANAVYKNTESDSFEAQGANYGADLDLTSLVIGADYGIAEGSKVGAYATFGTGDVDGKGAGHNVKNDVDTYGFGIYGSAKLASGVSILSDVGYTVAQNEFKGIVNADADMKVFTAGANVKYTFNTQVADISPFVGARYTSFNLESYAVKSAKGIVAYTDADTAHIFSIPVGFDLSKQIAAGEWNVKPAFTAKVTFNTGDKTVSSSTQFTGVKNALNLDAEVMDDVTYSVGASVSATKGAATFGAGLSYTGSSETNELSAQIGARYTF